MDGDSNMKFPDTSSDSSANDDSSDDETKLIELLPEVKCMIHGCKTRGRNEHIHYFCLSRKRYIPWMKAIGQNFQTTDLKPSYQNLICHKHFTSSDFASLSKKQLKENAVPTLNLHADSHSSTSHPDIVKFTSLEDLDEPAKKVCLNIFENLCNRAIAQKRKILKQAQFLTGVSYRTWLKLLEEKPTKKYKCIRKPRGYLIARCKNPQEELLIRALIQIEKTVKRNTLPTLEYYRSKLKDHTDLTIPKQLVRYWLQILDLKFKVDMDFSESEEQDDIEVEPDQSIDTTLEMTQTENCEVETTQTECCEEKNTHVKPEVTEDFKVEVEESNIQEMYINDIQSLVTENIKVENEYLDIPKICIKEELASLEEENSTAPVLNLTDQTETIDPCIIGFLNDIYRPFKLLGKLPTIDHCHEKLMQMSGKTISKKTLKQCLQILNMKHRSVPTLDYFFRKFRTKGDVYMKQDIMEWLQILDIDFTKEELDPLECDVKYIPLTESIKYFLNLVTKKFYEVTTDTTDELQIHPTILTNIITDVEYTYHKMHKMPTFDCFHEAIIKVTGCVCSNNTLSKWLDQLNIKYQREIPTITVDLNETETNFSAKGLPTLEYFAKKFLEETDQSYSKHHIRFWLNLLKIEFADEVDPLETATDKMPVDSFIMQHLKRFNNEFHMPEKNCGEVNAAVAELIMDIENSYSKYEIPTLDAIYDIVSQYHRDVTKDSIKNWLKRMNIKFKEEDNSRIQTRIANTEEFSNRNSIINRAHSDILALHRNNVKHSCLIPTIDYFHSQLKTKLGITCSIAHLRKWLDTLAILYYPTEMDSGPYEPNIKLTSEIITLLIKFDREFKSLDSHVSISKILKEIEMKIRSRGEIPTLNFMHYYLLSFRLFCKQCSVYYCRDILRHWLDVLKINFSEEGAPLHQPTLDGGYLPTLEYFYENFHTITFPARICSKTELAIWLTEIGIHFLVDKEYTTPNTIQEKVETLAKISNSLVKLARVVRFNVLKFLLRGIEWRFMIKHQKPHYKDFHRVMDASKFFNHLKESQVKEHVFKNWLQITGIEFKDNDEQQTKTTDTCSKSPTLPQSNKALNPTHSPLLMDGQTYGRLDFPDTSRSINFVDNTIKSEPLEITNSPKQELPDIEQIKSEPFEITNSPKQELPNTEQINSDEDHITRFLPTQQMIVPEHLDILNLPHARLKVIKLTDLPRVHLSQVVDANISQLTEDSSGRNNTHIVTSNKNTVTSLQIVNSSMTPVVDSAELTSLNIPPPSDSTLKQSEEINNEKAISLSERFLKDIEFDFAGRGKIPPLNYFYAKLEEKGYIFEKETLRNILKNLKVCFTENETLTTSTFLENNSNIGTNEKSDEVFDFEMQLKTFTVLDESKTIQKIYRKVRQGNPPEEVRPSTSRNENVLQESPPLPLERVSTNVNDHSLEIEIVETKTVNDAVDRPPESILQHYLTNSIRKQAEINQVIELIEIDDDDPAPVAKLPKRNNAIKLKKPTKLVSVKRGLEIEGDPERVEIPKKRYKSGTNGVTKNTKKIENIQMSTLRSVRKTKKTSNKQHTTQTTPHKESVSDDDCIDTDILKKRYMSNDKRKRNNLKELKTVQKPNDDPLVMRITASKAIQSDSTDTDELIDIAHDADKIKTSKKKFKTCLKKATKHQKQIAKTPVLRIVELAEIMNNSNKTDDKQISKSIENPTIPPLEVIVIDDDEPSVSPVMPNGSRSVSNPTQLDNNIYSPHIKRKTNYCEFTINDRVGRLFADVEFTFHQKHQVPNLNHFYAQIFAEFGIRFTKDDISKWLTNLGIKFNIDNR